jgi:hypothetical protein
VKVKEKLCPVGRLLLENFPVSLTMLWVAASRFVQVTVVPAGTVTEAGWKTKPWMVTDTGDGGEAWVVGGMVVITVAGGAVDCGTNVMVSAVVATVVAGGGVSAGVAGVVTGAGPEGEPMHPARRIASRRAAPKKGHIKREIRLFIEDSSRSHPSRCLYT